MDNLTVAGIFIYPIKSLSGISLETSEVTKRGLKYDRRWILVDENNQFLHQRIYPNMALLQPSISINSITIAHKNDPNIAYSFPVQPEETLQEGVTVWDDTCKAVEVSKAASAWFTTVLNINCRLMYMPDDSIRLTDPIFSIKDDDNVSFADGFPLLAISEKSLELLNSKTEIKIPVNRFRPNILVGGGHPHIEDELKAFSINGTHFFGVKPCARCIITTVDQNTAERGKEPLKSLSNYRKRRNNILFGQNIIPMDSGKIKIGNPILVKEWAKPIAF